MRALSIPQLLGVWEGGLGQANGRRALALLVAACPETSTDTLASLSIGQRDVRLLTLREWTFGSQIIGLVTCRGCGREIELEFNVADVRGDSDAEIAPGLSLTVAGYELHLRLPNSLDLDAVAGQVDTAQGERSIFERCLLAAHRDGELVSAERLPAEVINTVSERMAQCDPQADIQLSVCCPLCGHQWSELFDIVSFFWSEIDAWARRLLREVHVLALAYGWREPDILALSPWRRQLYLGMVSG